jgi:predicted ester cyclase
MSNVALLDELMSAFNQGNLEVFDRLLLPSFFGYTAQGGEPTAPEAWRSIVQALREALPDLSASLGPLTESGGELSGPMTLSGTFSGNLWGKPGDGQRHTVAGTVVARFEGERLALRWEGIMVVAVLRSMGVLPMPEQAHLKPAHPVSVPEIVSRLIFNGQRLAEKPCSHLDHIQVTQPATHVCAECVASGDDWPALRMCLECGYVGCCDVSVNKHMKQHCAATGHALIRSIHMNEAWLWCYPDSAFLGSRHLQRAA